jgi:murein DD-endopeptidase MepM/ murein hydrolase activator NlpD
METQNIYQLPIELGDKIKIANDSLAHVDDLINSIDFDAPEGTLILAAEDGVVIAVKDDSQIGGLDQSFENDGNYIEILHANNEVSEYEHLRYNSSRVKIGETVKAGQVIAEVGNTGWSACPHLHFMVYQKNQEYKTLKIKFKSSLW